MKKEAYVYKLPPCPAWDMAGIESWLEDMAKEGLTLVGMRWRELLFEFIKEEPHTVKYRLEAGKRTWCWWMPMEVPEHQQLQFYKDFGWEYVCGYADFHIFRSSISDAVELNTDPSIQASNLAYLKRRCRNALITDIFIMVPLLLFFLSNLFLLMAMHGNFLIILLCSFYIYFIFRNLYVFIRIHKLIRQLSSGQPMEHRKDWRSGAKKHYVFSAISWCVAIILLVCSIQYTMVDRFNFGRVPLDQWQEPVPFATYEELAPEDGSVTVRQISNGTVRQWSDLLMPVNYDWLDGGSYQYPGESRSGSILELQYHETVSPLIARQIAESNLRLSWLRYRNDPVELPELGFDFAAAYYNEWGMDTIVIQHSNIAICVTLGGGDEHGNFTTENWARLMAERLSAE